MRRYPVDNRIKVAGQIPFGQPDPNARYGRHAGDDSANGIGTNVYAAASGVVTGYVSSAAHGHVVEIQTPDGFFPHTLHLSQRLVSPGQTVQVGQLIGKTGNTGLSTGPHIHFGVSRKSLANVTSFADFVDPMQWITEGGNMPTIATPDIVESLAQAYLNDSLANNPGLQFYVGQPVENVIAAFNNAEQRDQYLKAIKAKDDQIAQLKAQVASTDEANRIGLALIKLLAAFGYKKS